MKYIDDDGFTRKVLDRLPPRRHPERRRFAIAMGVVLALGATCFLLRTSLASVVLIAAENGPWSWVVLGLIGVAAVAQFAPEEA